MFDRIVFIDDRGCTIKLKDAANITPEHNWDRPPSPPRPGSRPAPPGFAPPRARSRRAAHLRHNLLLIPPHPPEAGKRARARAHTHTHTIAANWNDLTSTVQDQFIWSFLDKSVGRTKESSSKLSLVCFKKLREQKEDKVISTNSGIPTHWNSNKCVAN